jgi:hypothetical protein
MGYIVQVLERMVEVSQIKGLSKRQWRNGFANIIELLNATHAAAGTPGQRAAALSFSPIKRRLESSICTSRPLQACTMSMP